MLTKYLAEIFQLICDIPAALSTSDRMEKIQDKKNTVEIINITIFNKVRTERGYLKSINEKSLYNLDYETGCRGLSLITKLQREREPKAEVIADQ